MTHNSTLAPRSAATRTRTIKAQLAQLDLAPVVRSTAIAGGQLHTLFIADADDRDLAADVLDALGWGPEVDRTADGFVSLFVPAARMLPRR